jgi:ABC-type glycerol-3-phosphate transport system substrate-binding protein
LKRVKKILKKIMMLMLFGAVSAASSIVLAASPIASAASPIVLAASSSSGEPARNADSSLAIANNAPNGDVRIQAASIGSGEVRGIVSQETDKSEMTLPATGWLLVTALIGFVMLSNRRGV